MTVMLLDDKSLTRSSVVANSTMNRERGLSGANSYTKDLGFAPLAWLEGWRPARWLDICRWRREFSASAPDRESTGGVRSGGAV
jgi:hypothetical protein